jgi:hypothetical protein
MRAQEYFTLIVEPLYDEAKQRSDKLHLLVSCIICSYHTIDYIKAETGQDKIKQILEAFPSFELVQALANASKHHKFSRDGHGNQFVGVSIDHVEAAQAIMIREGEAIMLRENEPVILHGAAASLPGGRVNLLDILSETIEFFRKTPLMPRS